MYVYIYIYIISSTKMFHSVLRTTPETRVRIFPVAIATPLRSKRDIGRDSANESSPVFYFIFLFFINFFLFSKASKEHVIIFSNVWLIFFFLYFFFFFFFFIYFFFLSLLSLRHSPFLILLFTFVIRSWIQYYD